MFAARRAPTTPPALAVAQNLHPQLVWIFVRHYRRQSEGRDGVAGWEAGVQARVCFLKAAVSGAFQRPLPREHRLQRELHDRHIGEGFERQQSGFPKVVAARLGAAEVEEPRYRQQRVWFAQVRDAVAEILQPAGIRRVFGDIFVRSDQRAGGAAENEPPLGVVLRGVEGTRSDGLLIVEDLAAHAAERVKVAGCIRRVFRLDGQGAWLRLND